MEIISGGECLTAHFNQDYRSWFRGRAAVFEAWIAAGRMDPVDPVHLIFLLWGSTQHYADFASQIGLVTGRKRMSRQDFAAAADNLVRIILKGCGLTRRRPERDAEHPARPRRIPRGNPQEPLPHHRRAGGRRDEAQAFIAAHRDASAGHNCWAWKCGAQYRFSDDGEPGGSAGRPILAAIEGQDMDCVAVLVSRWFGGIKLGTGGLARAWRRRGGACSRRRAASWSSAAGCASPVPSPTTRCSGAQPGAGRQRGGGRLRRRRRRPDPGVAGGALRGASGAAGGPQPRPGAAAAAGRLRRLSALEPGGKGQEAAGARRTRICRGRCAWRRAVRRRRD